MKRYEWKRIEGDIPAGIERGKCYAIRNHSDEVGTKFRSYDLVDARGKVVARNIPLAFLKLCDKKAKAAAEPTPDL